MTLDEAFIMTCHTGYICDSSFLDEEGKLTDKFLNKVSKMLNKEVFLEEFLINNGAEIGTELKKASYTKWMEIINSEKQ